MPKSDLPASSILHAAAGVMLVVLAGLCCRLHAENVSIAAASATAPKTQTTAVEFTITRDDTTLTETYPFTLSGTATLNVNYAISPAVSGTPPSGQVTMAAGTGMATIDVTPIDDGIYDGNVQVVVTVAAGSYTLVQPAASLVIIETHPLLSIAVTSAAALTPLVPGIFTVGFPGPVQTVPTTVFYVVSGMAQPGVDYTPVLSGTVVIPAGASSATIIIHPTNQLLTDTTTSVVVTLVAATPSAYGISSGSATMSILTEAYKPVPGMIATKDAGSSHCGSGAAFASLMALALVLGLRVMPRRVF